MTDNHSHDNSLRQGKPSRLSILNPNQQPETGAVDQGKGVSRRGFLKVLGGASAPSAAACADSATQNIYPSVEGDVTAIPGVATWFSSTCTECAAGCGVLVRTREGRITKLEGNPMNPINRGGLCAAGHSALQHLYDPDRIRQPLEAVEENGKKVFKPISWGKAYKRLANALKNEKGGRQFLTGPMTGSEKELLEKFCATFNVTHGVYSLSEPVALAQAAELAFGSYGVPQYEFSKAGMIVSLGADFLETWISPVEFARDWAEARRAKQPAKFVHIEPRMSLTASNADRWLKNKPGTELNLALALLQLIVSQGGLSAGQFDPATTAQVNQLVKNVNPSVVAAESGVALEALVKAVHDLRAAKHSLVVAGGSSAQSESAVQLHFVTHLINIALGNIGQTVLLGSMRKPQSNVSAIKEMMLL